MFKLKLLVFIILLSPTIITSQYLIEGIIDGATKQKLVHLDILDSWDGFSSVSDKKTIKSVLSDSLGKFRIEGNELDNEIGFYRIRYTDPTEYVMIQWLPRNYIVFSFSNKDTIQIQNTSFVPNNRSNLDLLPQILMNDSFSLQTSYARTKKHEQLLREKQKIYFKDNIKESDDAMNNLYSLYGGNFDILQDITLYKEVNQQLASPSIRPVYKQSLDNVIHLKEYSSLAKKLKLWFGLFLVSMFINAYLIYKLLTRKKQVTQKNIDIKSLTKKENEILGFIAEGKSNKEIAEMLFVSDATVKTHINNIYRKLNIKSRQKATELYNSQKSTSV